MHDDYHGTRIDDPYRWLEDLDGKATGDWVNAQTEFSRSVFERLPGRERVKSRLSELWNYSRTELPWRESGRIYFYENSGNEQQSSFFVIDAQGEAPRRLLNPQDISPDGSAAVENLSISPDGRWLCYGISPGGSDVGETHVRDVTTGKDLTDVIRRSGSEACWTLDSAGFFYVYRPAPPDGMPKGAASLTKQIRYHRFGSPSEKDPVIHAWPGARWLYSMLSDDGRRLIVVAEEGAISWMYAIDLGDPKHPEVTGGLTPLLAGVKANHTPMGTVGDTLYVFTDLEAPRRRIIALDLTRGGKAEPLAVIPEAAHVLNRATVAGNLLAVHYLEDVKSRLLLFTLAGEAVGEVTLPGIGALGWALNGRHSVSELWYTFTSFLSPSTVYRYDFATRTSVPFRPPRLPFDPTPYETRQVFYTSKDGTRIPMFITARKSLEQNGANPVFLTAYGGYGAITAPRYRADLPLWLERGGIYAVANLRGGGEYGEEWHRAGSLEHKQNSFDDFIAAAEYLVEDRYTTPEKIAIYGHSNGGLLIGAMITQRPELFGVALADAG
ncbi:MAG TPA: prolyl oligopeptidase family serine peptidase, partial [Candidatus Eisenbacteria bacterium]|nr:prolyl oligopeptidase family serine peptidase [Candidatus Eisenbacteria bacterium]